MPVTEFDIIRRYFERLPSPREPVLKGIGDDAALIGSRADDDLVIAIDSLVEAVHFPPGTPAFDIGYKALAVNLSDMAAMGAEPVWFTLALTLPDADEAWLSEFSRGLFELADASGVSLVGGDTTRGPLTVTVQIGGYVPHGQALAEGDASPHVHDGQPLRRGHDDRRGRRAQDEQRQGHPTAHGASSTRPTSPRSLSPRPERLINTLVFNGMDGATFTA